MIVSEINRTTFFLNRHTYSVIDEVIHQKGNFMEQLQAAGCDRPVNRAVNQIYEHLCEADAPLAMGYVPEQYWGETYELCRGLSAGTIFPCLHKPFCGRGGKCR